MVRFSDRSLRALLQHLGWTRSHALCSCPHRTGSANTATMMRSAASGTTARSRASWTTARPRLRPLLPDLQAVSGFAIAVPSIPWPLRPLPDTHACVHTLTRHHSPPAIPSPTLPFLQTPRPSTTVRATLSTRRRPNHKMRCPRRVSPLILTPPPACASPRLSHAQQPAVTPTASQAPQGAARSSRAVGKHSRYLAFH